MLVVQWGFLYSIHELRSMETFGAYILLTSYIYVEKKAAATEQVACQVYILYVYIHIHIYIYIYIYSASQESERSHGLYQVGDPVFLHDMACDLELAFHELREYMQLHAHARARPLVRLVSCGAEVEDGRGHFRLGPRLQPAPAGRIWDVTFAGDPAGTRRARRASDGCSGECGAIQVHMANSNDMVHLVREVRGLLSEDLVSPFFGLGAVTAPVPVTYKFQCRAGRHRSVAVCELLAHALHTSGLSSVEVVHEDLPLYVRGRDHHGEQVRGSCGCPDRCVFMTHSDGRVHHEWVAEMSDYLHEARRLVRRYWADYRM